nr:probable inactive receptor kinase At1g48480 [Ipomoea batatas]
MLLLLLLPLSFVSLAASSDLSTDPCFALLAVPFRRGRPRVSLEHQPNSTPCKLGAGSENCEKPKRSPFSGYLARLSPGEIPANHARQLDAPPVRSAFASNRPLRVSPVGFLQMYGASESFLPPGNHFSGPVPAFLSGLHSSRPHLLRASAEVLGKGRLGRTYKAVSGDGHCRGCEERLKDLAYYYSKEERLLVHDYLPMRQLVWLCFHVCCPGGVDFGSVRPLSSLGYQSVEEEMVQLLQLAIDCVASVPRTTDPRSSEVTKKESKKLHDFTLGTSSGNPLNLSLQT